MNQRQPGVISLADFLLWEQQQSARHEWIDGQIVPLMGVSFEHGQIATNLVVLLAKAVGKGPCFLQLSDRQLVPRDKRNVDLGSFYADLFVSCAAADRTGGAAHFPTVVIEILSRHIGEEFTRKKTAYLGSRDLRDYLIIDSTRKSVIRYSWMPTANAEHVLTYVEYQHGPVVIPSLELKLSFDEIYALTNVSAIIHPLNATADAETRVEIE